MNIEAMFAADVAAAQETAARLTAAGFPQCAADQVEAAVCELWGAAKGLGTSNAEIESIIARHTVDDGTGERWPRDAKK
jgi:hypothetical protein